MSFCRQEVAVFKNWSVMQNQVEICLGRADLFYVNGLVREMSTPHLHYCMTMAPFTFTWPKIVKSHPSILIWGTTRTTV